MTSVSMRRAVRRGESGGEVWVNVEDVDTEMAAGRAAGTGGGGGSMGVVERVEKCIDSLGGGCGALSTPDGSFGDIGVVCTVVLIISMASAGRDGTS